jgi:hypothetical protein
METGKNTLVVVDVQPLYASDCGPLMPQYVEEVKRRLDLGLDVILTVNDPEMSGDSAEDVADFWMLHGLDEDDFDRLIHVPKTYAFLRGWMDNGVPDEEIVQTLRALRKRGFHDTRDMYLDELDKVAPEGGQLIDPLFMPEALEYSEIAHTPDMDVCGGYRNLCLREFEIWLESRGQHYRRIEHLVY